MANTARAVLESALRARKLDRTLTTALPEAVGADAVAPLDIAPLDDRLRGGLPRGQVSEIAGPRSSGRLTLLLQVMAAAARRGEIVAFVDTLDRLDVSSLVAAGVDLERFLWIRGSGASVRGADLHGSRAHDHAVDRALKALNLVLQAGGFGVAAIDLGDVPMPVLRQLPYTTWLRVQRTIEASDTACVLLTPEPMARSAGGLTLALGGAARWAGDADRSRRLAGLDVGARVLSPRRRVEGDARVRCAVRG